MTKLETSVARRQGPPTGSLYARQLWLVDSFVICPWYVHALFFRRKKGLAQLLARYTSIAGPGGAYGW